jgi:hypothetical protein
MTELLTPAAETYTARFTAGPAVQSNKVCLTPCGTCALVHRRLGLRQTLFRGPQAMQSLARRHHFLPQGYLAGFTDTGRKDGSLHVLDIKTQRSFFTSPLNVAVEKDFKRVDIEGRAIDAIETALAPIEDRAVQAIRRVVESEEFPNDADHNLILNLLSLVLSQNPKSRRALNSTRAREADEKLSRLISSQVTWEHYVSVARKAGEELRGDITYDRARRFVEERRYRIEFSTEGTLRAEFSAQDQLLSALGRRTWTVLLAPRMGPYLIASDYPFSLTMEYGFRGHPTFMSDNTELFFPLSKTVGFIGIIGRPLQPIVKLSPRAMAIMSRRIVRQTDRRLFLSQKSFTTYERGGVVEVQV